jgi:hypothetical protein
MDAAAHYRRSTSSWKTYRAKHRWQRISKFPDGIKPPEKVRIYRQNEHFRLQWWDPAVKRNLSERVDGDLVQAISRAREIDERLRNFRTSGMKRHRVRQNELVDAFIADLQRRSDAGEIDPRTAIRYQTALAHYRTFVGLPNVESTYRNASRIDREFALQFAAWLASLQVAPNGHPHTRRRRMASTHYVQDIVRSMFEWASDADRGNLLPDGFRNPFAGKRRACTDVVRDPFGEPDITVSMAARFLRCCDRFQLPVFALTTLYGVRPSELTFLFLENISDGWLHSACNPALHYFSKGRRDKRLPLLDELKVLWCRESIPAKGLMFHNRRVADGRERPPLLGASRERLEEEFAQLCNGSRLNSARDRIRVRDRLLKDAGALSYDHVEHEFRKIARQLDWPRVATLKDFRHCFSTEMENSGMPEFYRRYLMGHSPGRSALVSYTHLNELREHYEQAARNRLKPVIETLQGCLQALGDA